MNRNNIVILIQKIFFFCLIAFALMSCGRDNLRTTCNDDSDCIDGECENGTCKPTTTNNFNNKTGCTSSTDCGTNEKCLNSECTPIGCYEVKETCFESVECVGEECSGPNIIFCDLECNANQDQKGCACIDRPCQSNMECGNLICTEGKCSPCMNDSECLGNQVCAEGQCVEDSGCKSDLDCRSNERCSNKNICIPRPECLLDEDCKDDELCVGGKCTFAPECKTDNECPRNFECVGDQCFEKSCRGPKDCPSNQICDAGNCVEPKTTVSCFVGTSDQIIVESQVVALEAFAVDASNQPIFAIFKWNSSNTSAATVNGSNAIGGNKRGKAVFRTQAVLPSGTHLKCKGETVLRNPGPVKNGSLRILVTDLESAKPLRGVIVTVNNRVVGTTGGGGVVNTMRPKGSFDVSVFGKNRNYVSVKNVNSDTIRIPTKPKSGSGNVAGFKGDFDFSKIHTSGQIELGLAGASLRGGLLDVNLSGLLGDNFLTNADIPGIGNRDLPLPGGLTIGGAFNIKSTYYARTSGGSRFAWGLAGKLPLLKLFQLFQGGGLNGTNLIATLLPLFSRFDHAAVPRSFVEIPQVRDRNDIDGDGDTNERIPNYASFPTIALAPAVPQTLVSDIGVSNFPFLSNGQAQVAVVVGGTMTAETGLVPLGITAIQDADGDGRPDSQRLSIAPNHGSLVGNRYAIVAIAFAGSGNGGQFSIPKEFSVALWNGQSFLASTRLGTFPDQSNATIRQRKITFTSDAGPLYRVRMVGVSRTWEVWDYGSRSVGQFSHGIKIPQPPSGVNDIWRRSEVYLDAIQTNTNLTGIVGKSGVGLENAGIISTAFNRTQIR